MEDYGNREKRRTYYKQDRKEGSPAAGEEQVGGLIDCEWPAPRVFAPLWGRQDKNTGEVNT
jgi:hypothetical protein